MSSKFNSFMEIALQQAQIAFDLGEVPVGAVIVDNKTNKIIASNYNQNITLKDSTAHAEILAIRNACLIKNHHRLDDCDLYVTLEPCPMCAAAISLARIKRVYYAASDPKSGGIENGPRIFSHSNCHHKPEIYAGISEAQSSQLLKKFFLLKR
jgi:tRNA(adenine34) deaminase